MNHFRVFLAAVVALSVCALVGAMEHDIRDLQARLAAQEARINDFHAKLAGAGAEEGKAPEGITSLRKNAVVTIGGLVNTKYTYTNAKAKGIYDATFDPDEGWYGDSGGAHDYRRRADYKGGSLEVSDAEVHLQIDVNDNLEAFVLMNLHETDNQSFGIAEAYYLRWKDICNTGFGLKAGRDALVFGADGVGELGSYAAGGGDGLSELSESFNAYAGLPVGSMALGGIVPVHNGWDVSGVTQLTPYWEGLDGKVTAEVSFFQNVYDDEPFLNGTMKDTTYYYDRNGRRKYRSRNYGAGSMTARLTAQPIEDLSFTLSFGNYRSNGEWGNTAYKEFHTKNNTIYGLAANWRPCFFNRLNIWGQWVHGENVYFHRDMKSDAVNFGASLDLIEGMTFFAQGDYLRTKYDAQGLDSKGTAWAFYTGLSYSLPYGVSLEAGWKHEQVTYKSFGQRTAKVKGDTIYAMCGFEF